MRTLTHILTIGLAMTFLSCGNSSKPTDSDLEFESEKWTLSDATLKGKMVTNLMEDSLWFGRSRFEVLEMLGEPDQLTNDRLVYAVDPGATYLGSPWTYWLTVEFDTLTDAATLVRLDD